MYDSYGLDKQYKNMYNNSKYKPQILKKQAMCVNFLYAR